MLCLTYTWERVASGEFADSPTDEGNEGENRGGSIPRVLVVR